jgi:PAS domain S-box-containing protein
MFGGVKLTSQFRVAAALVACVVGAASAASLLLTLAGVLPMGPGPPRDLLMAPPTAAALALVCGSLLLHTRRAIRRRAADALARAALAVILAGLLGPLVGLRSSGYNTVVCVVLVVAALLLLDRRPRLSQWITVAAATIALLTTAGYAYRSPVLFGAAERRWGMALVTALALLLVSGALLCARPRVGFMTRLTLDDVGGRLLRRILPAILLIPVGALALTTLARGGELGATTLAAVLAVAGMGLAALFVFVIAGTLSREALAQARYQQLVESSSDAIINTDRNGIVLQWNAAAERMYGYRASEMIGRYVMGVVPLPERKRLGEIREAILRDGESGVFEGARLRRDGTSFFGSTTLSPIHDSMGNVIGMVAVTRDITLRRAFERVDEASQAIARALAELPHDVPSVLRAIVAQACALTGAQKAGIGIVVDDEQPFSPWLEVSSELPARGAQREVRGPPRPAHLDEDRPDFSGALAAAIHFRGRLVGKLYLVHRKGFSVVDAFVTRLIAERAGAAIETARAHALAVEESARLHTVIDQLPDAFVLLDADGRVAQMNRAALALATHDRPDAFGNQVAFDLRRPSGEPLPLDEQPLTRALRRREATRNVELLVRDPGGRTIPHTVNAAPIAGPHGEVIGAVQVAVDISAAKELERLREEWTALVAHDLRQPVSIIRLSSTAMASQAGGDARLQAALERIDRATRHLERMINDLLDVSQLEAHRLKLDLRPVDLNALVENAVHHLAPLTAGHPVRIHVAREPLVAAVDAGRIGQVLGNLISNAVKYSPPESEITVAAARSPDGVATLSVRNLGGGIPAEELPRLFGRFSRSRASREGGPPGLGLGLFISKGIVEAHGGTVAVESVPGESTVFSVSLPLVAVAAADRHA